MRGVLNDSAPDSSGGPSTQPYQRGALPTAPAVAELAPHFPELEILELLGQGGMGAVYKARQLKLDRLVALKILPPELSCDPAFAERFAREARALARLNHPQVVAVYDFGKAGGHYFLLMEYVDGGSLRQLLTAGPLPPPQALPVVGQICDALQYAHEQGVVHRDIKPENILLDRRGQVKIADFGLAKLLRRSRSEFTLTGVGQVMGTQDYMAPEQRTSPQAVDHRADIYSLGVVFYEMLTGELPVGCFAPPSQKASVDGRLDDVIFRTLEREPDRRYQRISAVKVDVESIGRAEVRTPAAAPRRPVRSFFLSMFSMFAPRSMLGGAKAADRPAPGSQPAEQPPSVSVPLPPRQASRRPLAAYLPMLGLSIFLILQILRDPANAIQTIEGNFWTYFVLLCGAVWWWSLYGNEEQPEQEEQKKQEKKRVQLEGLVLGNPDELIGLWEEVDTDNLKRILASADREYLELEQRHTSRMVSRDAGSEDHLLVTISAFPQEAIRLENRVWAKLTKLLRAVFDDCLDEDTKRKIEEAKEQLPPRGALFAFGQEEARIEIWREGVWYYWKVSRTAAGKEEPIEQGNGTELPRRYQRFWQGGPSQHLKP
jgi:serine/threonine protein kinase